MKKNILTKYLPFVAAVLLAASCGKDDNGGDSVIPTEDVVQPDPNPNPDPNPDAPKTVTIPFSVKVDDGTSLSKIHYAEKGNVVSRSFDEGDCDEITLTLSGTGVDASTAPLDLKYEDGAYVFYGDVTVESNYADAFTEGTMPLTGTFEYFGQKDNVGYSTTSLIDLEENHCDHTFKAEFKSGAEEITFVDQNAYLCFTVADTQFEFDLTFNGSDTKSFTPDAETHKIWIAVPSGGSNNLPTVNCALVSSADKDLKPGTVYKVNRRDVVDLGTADGVLWTTCNIGANKPWEYGDYYAWGEVATKDVYTWDTYKYGRSAEDPEAMLNKYCPKDKTSFWDPDGDPDGKLVLDPEDNIVIKKNITWSMPTKENFIALYQNCVWVKTDEYEELSHPGEGYEFAGYIVYKKNADGNHEYDYKKDTHIFLPAAGQRWQGRIIWPGEIGCYWASSLGDDNPIFAYELYFNGWNGGEGEIYDNYRERRYNGQSVRAVRRMNMNSFSESYDNGNFESEKEIQL